MRRLHTASVIGESPIAPFSASHVTGHLSEIPTIRVAGREPGGSTQLPTRTRLPFVPSGLRGPEGKQWPSSYRLLVAMAPGIPFY